MSDTRSIYDLIRSAYAAQQDNVLPSVLASFQADLVRLCVILETCAAQAGDREVSQATLRRHPVCVMYSTRICQLTGSEVAQRAQDAYQWCQAMLQQERWRSSTPVPTDSN
jgi:hypothetical protein